MREHHANKERLSFHHSFIDKPLTVLNRTGKHSEINSLLISFMESLAHVLHSARELVTRKLKSTGKATKMVNLTYVPTANQGHDLIKLRNPGECSSL